MTYSTYSYTQISQYLTRPRRYRHRYLDGWLEWKTSSSRYPEEPEGLLSLDPQLVCSWITGIAEVAQVVFVRKHVVEIQYLRTTITDEQREEFGHLVQDTIRRIESAQFVRSYHTVESAFRRIHAVGVPTWDCVSGNRRWLTRA